MRKQFICGEGNHQLSFYTKKTWMLLPMVALLIVATLSFSFPAGNVYADGAKIGIQSEMGYQGKIKHDKWNPLKLTLTSDRDLSGDVVVQIQNYNGFGYQTSYVQQVDLPKDTPKEVVIGIPGAVLNKDNNQILFYEGSYTKGKQIPFASGKNYVQASPYQGALIAVLSDDPDTMNFMNVLNGKGNSVNVFPLKNASVPSDGMLLNGLDAIVINNFASDTLSEPQRKAITDWVNGGGTLILAGGAGYAKTAAPFADITPVVADGTTTVHSLAELEKLGGKPLKLDGAFTISTAKAVEGAQIGIEADGQPLFASKAYGQGSVQYAAYDLAMEPVSSWAGHPDAWASILRNNLPMVGAQNGMYYNSLMDSLNYVLEYFPSLKMPSFTLLLWMLIIYAVVVAPLLYYILKKADKREWAWFLIPIIAVIASGSVYVVGSSDKTRELAHTINLIELNGQGDAVKSTASAFFTPRSGNYALEFPENTYLKTGQSQTRFGGMGENKSFVRVEQASTTLELRDMSQWSLAKVWVDRQGTEEMGRLGMDLKLDAKGELNGKVTNDTINDLTEVVLVVGGKAYKLGDIKKGDAAAVPQDPKQIIKFTGGDLSGMLYPYSQNDPKQRERDILSQYGYSNRMVNRDAYILGWSKDHLTNYTLKGAEVDSDQLNFWIQPVEMDWGLNGEINIPYGFLSPEISQVNAPMFGVYPHGVEMGQGSLIAEFPLILEGNVKYSELSIKGTKFNNNVTMEIWNSKKSEWEPVTDANNVFTITKNPEQYIVGNRIRFMITAKDQTNFMMPELSVKGEATQ
ncbi:hypothetical protein [Paenibacillus sp. MDMC362]|uniref:DUF7408 domain-containing protein n=1 Tax=Paenibacillus sp. MDMC362 TaxID=2977365 RepID=UPI000DC340FA|nr:hypothetical protein [Paenibacillus sp. MDMC362]RAR41636.1 hypothetical protein DP091_22630 [Paenibacillus sp. MDMC362]